MATNTLFLTNLTANKVSIEGDHGSPKISIGTTASQLNPREFLDNDLLCTTISTMITAGTIRVNRGSATGTLISAAAVTSYKDQTYWDTDQDGLLDDSAASLLNTAHRTSAGTDHSDVGLNNTHRGLVTGNPHVVLRSDLNFTRVNVSALSLETLNNEQSTAIGGAATDEFSPLYAIVQMEDVGVGAAANGDAQITIGITTGGTEILTATVLTSLISLNDKFKIDLPGLTAAIPADSTIYVKVTTADTGAGASHLGEAFIVGEMFVSGA